jgi:anti-sigma factor RsiW
MIGAREGELLPAEASALEAHLAACAACRAIAADVAATEGLLAEALLAKANARDFAPFVDEVMARVEGPARAGRRAAAGSSARGLWSWLAGHRRAAAAALAPILAAAALLVYVRLDDGREQVAMLELYSEGEVTMVLQTADGPVVLLSAAEGT